MYEKGSIHVLKQSVSVGGPTPARDSGEYTSAQREGGQQPGDSKTLNQFNLDSPQGGMTSTINRLRPSADMSKHLTH